MRVVGGAREERCARDEGDVTRERGTEQHRGVPPLRQPRPDEHAAVRVVPGRAGGQRVAEARQQRVAARAVDRPQARRGARRCARGEHRARRPSGRWSRCGGRRPAWRSSAPAAAPPARASSRSAGPGARTFESEETAMRAVLGAREAARARGAARRRSAARRTGRPRAARARARRRAPRARRGPRGRSCRPVGFWKVGHDVEQLRPVLGDERARRRRGPGRRRRSGPATSRAPASAKLCSAAR